jgi:desulfoferrodoxin (superoxide reductase-like protein)
VVPLGLLVDLKTRTFLLGVLLVLSFLAPSAVIYANVPTVLSLEEVRRGNDDVLVIEVSHSSPSSTHYIDSVEVEVGEQIYTIEDLGEQSSTVITVEHVLESPGAAVRVRAHCNLHGWSQWTQLGEEPADEGGGIPGFGDVAILIGLTAYLVAVSIRRQG